MDLKKIIEEQKMSDFPIGLGGCRLSENHFDSCGFDMVVFDGKSDSDKIIQFNNEFVLIHHATFSETQSKKLLQYDNLQIVQDDSWDLRMFLSKIKEKRNSLFTDLAKNSLIESLFCCQKTRDAIDTSDVFASCWQKCASYYLADAILSLNHQRLSPSHNLDLLRKLEKSLINENISVIEQTVGIQRTTPVLLKRMLKSTIGFSDLIEQNNNSKTIQQKYDFFVKNSMLSDCYFYLGYVNKENFVKIKNTLNRQQDLFHILKIAFDIDADSNLLLQQAALIQKSCNDLLVLLRK
ncbi:MAG TPA: hypothetical protein QF518_03700 [Nitrosopumilus sp.]|jgi:hypothetical protein|nr:hypothetical protein [Nitrososphaerota archaeon]MDP6327612.1 hypothetical protein [Nitrosopumilus sp.]HJM25537.1 hypothetical protein [Nitrosopumilus sp.]HJO31714.1 hypothetical protein [Nitrosopumilus sp.]|tara:strand:+ start:6363 stop:7244 length:882 start_codon:yes stop_codon:yes gene_type:complete